MTVPLNSQLLSAPISASQLRHRAGLKVAPGEDFHQNDASLVQTSPAHLSGLRMRAYGGGVQKGRTLERVCVCLCLCVCV